MRTGADDSCHREEVVDASLLAGRTSWDRCTLPSLGGCPGVKPPVGVAIALHMVDNEGLGEGISALCMLSQIITLLCSQMPPLGLSFNSHLHRCVQLIRISVTNLTLGHLALQRENMSESAVGKVHLKLSRNTIVVVCTKIQI